MAAVVTFAQPRGRSAGDGRYTAFRFFSIDVLTWGGRRGKPHGESPAGGLCAGRPAQLGHGPLRETIEGAMTVAREDSRPAGSRPVSHGTGWPGPGWSE